MTENKAQEPNRQALRESVFAKEKTYGEKKYDFIFGNLINFWVNLLASGVFTFWVTHSKANIKLPGMEKPFSLNDWHANSIKKLDNSFIQRGIADMDIRHKRSAAIMNVFTLLIPGHIIMIPSVWLGAKIKAPVVKYFNRKHYGDAAMDSSELQKRHYEIETAERPTFIGTVLSRIGTAVCTTTTARVIGSEGNLLSKLLPNFHGMDPLAGKVGEHVREVAHDIAPTAIKKFDAKMTNPKYFYSDAQKKDVAVGKSTMAVDKPYNRASTDLSRFISQDVLYTLITAGAVHPILNLLKKYVPGMTYKPKAKSPPPSFEEQPVKPKSYHFDEVQIAEEPVSKKVAERPIASVSEVQNDSTIHKPRAELSAAAGASV